MARTFNGTNQYLTKTTPFPISTPPFTIGCRFNADINTADGVLMDIADSDDIPTIFRSFRLQAQGTYSGDPVIAIAHNDTEIVIAQTTTGYTINTWHTAVMTCSHVSGVVYLGAFIDGGSKGVASGAFTSFTPDRNSVGVAFITDGGLTTFFDGNVADVFFVNRVMTDAEIASYHQNKTIESTLNANVVSAYRLHNGDTNRDSRSNYNLTAVGTQTYTSHPGGVIYPNGY